MPLLTDNRAHYSADDVGERYYQRDKATYRLQLIAYLRAINAWRTYLAATLLHEQYPASDRLYAAYIRALENYTLAITRLPSWCVPPSYVAEGM